MANNSYVPSIHWWGQIVNDEVWKSNLPESKWKYSDEFPGYGTRYKVAILGRDSQNKDTPDDQLEWADVIYPVTAGSGHGGSYETASLRKGAFVFGIYRDGMNMRQPVILGCLGNNEQIPLAQSIPIKNFVPFSGYIGERVSVNDIPAEGSCPPKVKHITPNGVVEKDNKQPIEGANSQNRTSAGDQEREKSGKTPNVIYTTSRCDKIPVNGIQTDIRNFIIDIQNFKSTGALCRWRNSIFKPIKEDGQEYSVSEYISFKAQNISKYIAAKIRDVINLIQNKVTEGINAIAKKTYSLFMPNERNNIKTAIETAEDLKNCLFRKIIANLTKMITDMLLKIAERFINAPLCAIENIIASLMGNLLNFITSAVEAILKSLQTLLGTAFDFVGGILDFAADILSFISCDEDPECSQITEWTSWEGATKFNVGSNISNITTKIKNIASSLEKITDVDNFDFNLNFDNVFQDSCNVGPIFCGPPTVEFYGGGGSGAAGNAIISATGEILGVDLTSFGSGYTSAPTVRFVDACGKGRGAVGKAILGTGNRVTNVLMKNSGSGYLSSPNGDRGGDGRTWATKDQTTVKREDGTYDIPYNPGETFPVNNGDEVYSCGRTILITQTQEYTAPVCPGTRPSGGEEPSLNNGRYPVFLELDSVAIDSPGINYDSNDKVVITPDNGAKVEPVFDSNGSLKKVNVISSGIGFTRMPSITIQTESGYNASLLPIFKVNRLGDTPDGQDVPQTQIISVIDCVGKFNV